MDQICPAGPLTVQCLELLGITSASVSTLASASFALVLGFWGVGYSFGLVLRAIRRA